MTDESVTPGSASAAPRLIRRTMKDSAIYLPATITQGLGGIVVTMVISKLSTPAEFGNYTMGVNLAMALSMIAGQWMNESLIRLSPEYQQSARRREMYGSLLYGLVAATLLIGILTWVGLFAFESRIDRSLYRYLAVAAGTFPLMVGFSSVRSWCRATGRSLAFSALIIWRVVGGILLGLLLYALWQAGTIGFLWGMVLAWCVVVLGFVIQRRRVLHSIFAPGNFSHLIVGDALRYSLPMQGIAVSALVLSISDRYLIGGFLSSYLVGIYALGYAIAQKGMELVTQSFFRALQPVVFRAWAQDGAEETRKLIQQLSRYFALAAVPLATGITILSREVVVLFSSVEYAEGAQVVGAVAVAMIFYGYARLFEVPFALTKRTMPLLVVYLVTTAFNIIINVLFIPRFGYIVAAWSTLASYLLMMVLLGIWSRREMPISVFGVWVWKPLVAAGLMALAVLGLKRAIGSGIVSMLVEIVAGILVYGIVIVATGGLSRRELQTFVGLVKRRLPGAK